MPTVEVDGRQLKLSNLDKVLYPAVGFTKGEVIDYYTRIAPVLVDHVGDRGVTLRRYPDGVEAGRTGTGAGRAGIVARSRRPLSEAKTSSNSSRGSSFLGAAGA